MLGKATGPAGLRAAGRPLRRRLRPLPRHLAGVARGDGRQGRRLPGRGLSALPAQGRRRPGRGHRAHPRRRGRCCSRATAWSPTPTPAGCMHDAMRVVRAVRDVDVYIEQPCLSYEECLTVRRHTDHPFVLDEVIDSHRHAAARPRRPGDGRGQPQDQQVRRPDEGAGRPATCASSLGIAMTLEDSWGGDIVDRRHRPPGPQHAAGVPVHRAPTSTATSPVSIADGAPQRVNGRMAAGDGAGPGRHAADGRAGQAGPRSGERSRVSGPITAEQPGTRMTRMARIPADQSGSDLSSLDPR